MRRIHHPRRDDPTRRDMVWRSVTCLATGTRAQMLGKLGRLASGHGAELGNDRFDIARAALLEPAGDRYQLPERRLVVAPDGVVDKQRPAFTERWHRLVGHDPGPCAA
ncbi:hypothetical protein ACFOY4_01170 [Actinomadura syzygii]|uniref:Uncharacterized protein n=1 Tax=Actinomadura syzygii TaxID=1427538 RepID=A0A5D0TS10_9ACTN|nr:hypothetical protein [Actinomadura syzygii]TYC08637.1 hypothetical protein FXF65_37745 [Actinomadura syzygii]